VKSVLAIVFSVMLIGTPFLSVAAAPCTRPVPRDCCHDGMKMACCDAKSDSQPLPMVPVTNPSPGPSLFTAAVVLWVMPESPAATVPSIFVSPSADAALYARHCALLL
jgi:hypothetical protein